jgi:hypothetical protein
MSEWDELRVACSPEDGEVNTIIVDNGKKKL